MFYEKSQAPTLTASLFKNPTAEYRGAPFWAWNGKLSADMLCEQIEVFCRMGFGGFHMHARLGLETPYLGDAFMDAVATCVKEADRLGMYAYLYDEDRCPSGYAGGYVTAEPQFCQRYMTITDTPLPCAPTEAEGLAQKKSYLIGVYDIELGADATLLSWRRIEEASDAQHHKMYIYAVPTAPLPYLNDASYVDTLNKDAIQAFINCTHARYKAAVGEQFGKVIPSIFSDEMVAPHYGWYEACDGCTYNMFWSPRLSASYAARYGEVLADILPTIFFVSQSAAAQEARYRFFDTVAELFATSYADTLGDWCEKNHLFLTGHYHAEPTLREQSGSNVDLMRQYRAYHLPGVDMLCGGRELTTVKQAQSVAHQYGRAGILSELYGVSSWDFDFRGYKSQGDWQAALGVTLRVPHLSFFTMKGEGKRDYPASFGYQSPWHTAFSYVENHFARLNTALTRGKPMVRVAVVHPIETYWLHIGAGETARRGRDRIEHIFQNLTRWLLTNQMDFDFLSESLLPTLWNGKNFGAMSYDAVLIPGCETLRTTTLDILQAFLQSGGRVLFLGNCPTHADGVPSDLPCELYGAAEKTEIEESTIITALEPLRTVAVRHKKSAFAPDGIPATSYIYTLRRDTDCLWLFLANAEPVYPSKAADEEQLTIKIKGTHFPYLYDTVNGTIHALPYTHAGGATYMEKTLSRMDSLLVQLCEKPQPCDVPSPQYDVTRTVKWDTLTAYRRAEANVLLLDKAAYALDDAPFLEADDLLRISTHLRHALDCDTLSDRDVQPWARSTEPEAVHMVSLRFVIHSTIPIPSPILALEDAAQTEITCNGEAVAATPIGYYVDKAIEKIALPALHTGENTLTLRRPFFKHDNLEWCYLLGEFGVSLRGAYAELCPLPDKIGFSSTTHQGMPFYGGNLHYSMTVDCRNGEALRVSCPFFRGAAILVLLDGTERGIIAYPPYSCIIHGIEAGTHTLTLTLLGTRQNTFGPMHNTDASHTWYDPMAWRTEGRNRCDAYRLKEYGILQNPTVDFCTIASFSKT